jgi:hypothetical protein
MRKIQYLFYNKLKNFYKTDYVEEYSKAVDLTIHTKAPGKWLLIDMETGQKYVGSSVPNKYGKWIRLDNLIIE